MSRNNFPNLAAWLFIAAIIAGCALMGHVIWPQAEDINAYGCNPELLSPLGLPAPPFSVLTDNAVDSYLHDNGRFVNYSDILLTALTPRWVWMLLDILLLCVLFRLLWLIPAKASRRNPRQAACVLLTGILALLFIPWNDYLFLQRYTTPYLWGAAMMLFVTYGAMRAASGDHIRPPLLAALSAVAFICGGWHEGISLTLGCGLVALWFFVPRGSRRNYLLPAMFLLAGILLNLTAPGQSSRAESVGVHLNIFNWFQPATLTGGVWLWPHIVPMLLYLCLLLCAAFNHRARLLPLLRLNPGKLAATLPTLPPMAKLQILCATVAGATLGMGLFFSTPRVAIPGLIFSVVGLISLAIHYYPMAANKTAGKAITLAASLCAVILTAGICLNIAMQEKLSRDHRAIQGLLAESTDGEVYYDPVPWPHKSHYPWQWTMNHYYVDYVPLHFLLTHPANTRHMPLRLIPSALREIPRETPIEGITLIDGNLVSDAEPGYSDPADSGRREEIYPGEYPFLKVNARVKTASGREATRFFEVIPFTTSKGSPAARNLYYFRPVWQSHAEVSDPATEIITLSPAKYW